LIAGEGARRGVGARATRQRRWRKVKVIDSRTAVDFAACMQELVDIHFSKVERIRVVPTRPAHFIKPSRLPKAPTAAAIVAAGNAAHELGHPRAALWADVRKVAGIPKNAWNRDMRAADVTEAREAGVATADWSRSSAIRSAHDREGL
jgi:hypothetical protein